MDATGNRDPIASRKSLRLELPPSCIQFCPAHPCYFVVGTYNLQTDGDGDGHEPNPGDGDDEHNETSKSTEKKTQNRDGSLVLFRLDGEELTLVQTVRQPSAILDSRFHHHPDHQNILAVVSSTGTLAVFRLDPVSDPSSPLVHLSTSRCEDLAEDVLFLQCNWYPSVHIPGRIGVTTSTGLARILCLDNEWKISAHSDLDIANSLEAWCIAFSPLNRPNLLDGAASDSAVYCGGDDSMLRYTSCTWGESTTSSSTTESPMEELVGGARTLKRRHDAGVTAILPLPLVIADGARWVFTGSYDDHLRLFLIYDQRATWGIKRPELVIEENLGGGVWRLDLIDQGYSEAEGTTWVRLLASCMHAGARVVEIRQTTSGDDDDGSRWTCSVLGRFEEHESMNYGSAVVPRSRRSREESGGSYGLKLECISTSFYDRLLCLWECQVPLREGVKSVERDATYT